MGLDILTLKAQVGEYLLNGAGADDEMEKIVELLKQMSPRDQANWVVDTILARNNLPGILLAEAIVTPLIKKRIRDRLGVYLGRGELA